MTTTHAAGKTPGFTWVTPVLCVDDLPASLAYYADTLGFAVSWRWSEGEAFDAPDHPTFACVARGEISVFLCERGQGTPGSWICVNVATLDDLETMHEEYVASGATIVQPPTDEPWGQREMVVEDLDRNTFRIGVVLG